jgi:hypothetical protein
MSKIEKLEEKLQDLEELYHSVECEMEWAIDTEQDSKAQRAFARMTKIQARIKIAEEKLAKLRGPHENL